MGADEVTRNVGRDETTMTELVSDQGNGGVICDKCKYYKDFGGDFKRCPGCYRTVVATKSATPYPYGGSDF